MSRRIVAGAMAAMAALTAGGTGAQEKPTWEETMPIGGAIFDLAVAPVEPPRGETEPTQIVLAGGLGLFHTDGAEPWARIPRPGRVRNVVAGAGGVIYVAYPKESFRSVNGGRSWTRVSVRENEPIQLLAVSPDWPVDEAVYFITSADGRLYRSNKGSTGTHEVAIEQGQEHWTGGIAFSPEHFSDETIFAGTSVGIFKSVDNGQTWQKVSDESAPAFGPEGGPPSSQGLIASPDYGDDPDRLADPIDSTLFAYNVQGVYRSDDDGVSWRRLALEVGAVNDLAVSTGWPRDRTLIAAVADPDGTIAAVSMDGGAQWRKISGRSGVAGTAVGMSLDFAPPYRGQPRNGIYLPMTLKRGEVKTGDGNEPPEGSREAFLATDGDGVWRTNDGGVTWQPFMAGLAAVETTSLAMLPGGPEEHVLAGTNMTGVYRSEDGGRTFLAAETTLPRGEAHRINAIAMSPGFQTDRVALLAASSGVWMSRDGGRVWAASAGAPANPPAIAISPAYATDRLVMVPGAVSRDGGASWSAFPSTAEARALAFSPDFATDATIWMGATAGLSRSTNGGETWELLTRSSLLRRPVLSVLAVRVPLTADPVRVFAGTENGSAMSEDNGETWTRAATITREVYNLAAATDLQPPGAVIFAAGTGGASFSLNRGIDWLRDADGPDPAWAATLSTDGSVALTGSDWVIARANLTGE